MNGNSFVRRGKHGIGAPSEISSTIFIFHHMASNELGVGINAVIPTLREMAVIGK